MGVYCCKISKHGVQHELVTMHIVTESDLVRIHAPSSRNKCILPRSTHTHLESECDNELKHLTAQTIFSATTRGSQQFTCSIPLQSVYTCAAAVCVSPCSLVISTQSGCTIWCTSDNESYYQWTWDCLLTLCIDVVTSFANPCGACTCQLRP